jgi:hypothetical protein
VPHPARRTHTRIVTPPAPRPASSAHDLAQLLADPHTRRQRRGLPLAGTGGLDTRRDPFHELAQRLDHAQKRRARHQDGPHT